MTWRTARLPLLAATLLAVAGAAVPAQRAALAPVLDGLRWGETSDALARHFGGRTLRLAPPIAFGDSYVDVALRGQIVAGYRFAVYFQMDRASGRLKRVMLERQRHGANPMVFRAVVAALTRDYGAPALRCALPPSPRTGYQGTVERLWRPDGMTVRAVFRDTTLEAAEGCVAAGSSACGLAGHLYVQILPGHAGCA
ncbi:MAG TPA: hypothetical protein VMU87_08595 [Stellaceae bacterium]|nr:hypothetical protein [Stellaceae bacterium]